jgi:hypothetical protein
VSGGYEIVGGVPSEIGSRERAKRCCSSFELVSIAPCTHLARKGCVASNVAKCGIWAWIVLGLSKWALGVFDRSRT